MRVHLSYPGAAPAAESVKAETPEPGAPLPTGVRAHLQARLGIDLATVRIRADEGEETLAMGARAVTRRNTIAFAPGFFTPSPHDRLLAHELVHVAQHANTSGALADDARLEAEAERGAAEIVAGRRARPALRAAGDTPHRADLTEEDIRRLPYERLQPLIAALEQRAAGGVPAEEATRLNLLTAAATQRLLRERPTRSEAAPHVRSSPPAPEDQRSPVAEIDGFLHRAGIDGEQRERLRAFIRDAPSPETTARALLPQAPADMIGKIADWAGASAARVELPIPGPLVATIRRALRLGPKAYVSRAQLATLYQTLQYPAPAAIPPLAGDDRARVMEFLFRTLPPPADPDPVVADAIGGGKSGIGPASTVKAMQEEHRRAVQMEALDAVRSSALGTVGALAARAADADEETVAAAAKAGQALGQLGHLAGSVLPGTRRGTPVSRVHGFEPTLWGARTGPGPGHAAATPALPGAYTILSTSASGTILSDRAMATTSVTAHPNMAALESAMGRAGITFQPNGRMPLGATATASYLRVSSPSGESFERARIEFDPRRSVLQDIWHELNHVRDFRAGKAPPMRFVRAASEAEFNALRGSTTAELFRIAETQLKGAAPRPPMDVLRSEVRFSVNEASNHLRDIDALPGLGRSGYTENSGKMVMSFHQRLRVIVEQGNVAGAQPLTPAERKQLAAYVRSYVLENFPELPAEYERFFPRKRFWDVLKDLE